MIQDPPLLTVRRGFARPPADRLARLTGAMTSQLCDALGGRGALDYRIKPLGQPGERPAGFTGTAVTCHTGPADNLALFAALDVARPGDVLVIATDGFTGTSVAGDQVIGMARNKGVVAVVTDGLARDVEGILAVGIPVFCAGVTPNSPARNGPGSVGLPVTVGGVPIASGDIVVGDRDGVVVVPHAALDAVEAALDQVRAAEAALEAKVKAGLTVPDFMRDVLAGGRVREVA